MRPAEERMKTRMKETSAGDAEAAILEAAGEMEERVIAMRRALHAIPEASFCEHKTAAMVSSLLTRAGIAHKSKVAGTGVVGMVRGAGRATIALRSDMDALEMQEETGLDFSSRHKGFMHACGHDAHMAMTIGAGLVLKRLGRRLPGNVKLIFQPAEEKPPGGAPGMIAAGVLKRPRVEALLGIHLWHPEPEGRIGVNSGPMSAAADDFRAVIRGRGGHGARPHETVDSIVVAAEYITALQTIASRRADPLDSVVVTVGKIRGGSRFNIIAQEVEMEGTVRTRSRVLRRGAARMMRDLLTHISRAHGATGKLEYIWGYPALICDERLTGLVRDACVRVVGRRNVRAHGGFEMGGEDIAYFAEEVPTTVIFLGVGRKSGRTYPIHHPRFTFNEKVLKIGVGALALSAYRYLERGRDGGRRHGRRRVD
jgi:amidohydrolase